MSVEIFDVTHDSQSVISVTEAAAAHLLKQVQLKGMSAVRLSVKESGCTGYMYVMEEVDAPQSGDLTVSAENDLTVSVSYTHLRAHET